MLWDSTVIINGYVNSNIGKTHVNFVVLFVVIFYCYFTPLARYWNSFVDIDANLNNNERLKLSLRFN